MASVYSTYDAKARFSEILRKVRAGESVFITYRGSTVAEIKPVKEAEEKSLEERLDELRRQGILSGPPERRGDFEPLGRRPGALKRFLAERD